MCTDTPQILWKATSSAHDWRDGALLRRLLARATALGLIGAASWVKPQTARRPEKVSIPAGPDMADALLALAPPYRGEVEFTAGGEGPVHWELFWNVCPYNPEYGVTGINTFWLTFAGSVVRTAADNEALLAAFRGAHTPTDTEYAMIHPYQHWQDFTEEHYPVPITIAPMFCGVFWANYLSGKQLAAFDLAKLAALPAASVWTHQQAGLGFVAADSLQLAHTADSEAHLLSLSQACRKAMRPDSCWAD